MDKTLKQFDQIMKECATIFIKKTKDYGTSWRILRPASLTDQLYIKAKRIRSIEEKGTQKVMDSIESDYIGLVNYSLIAIIQLQLPANTPLELEPKTAIELYEDQVNLTRDLLIQKNHDYGEVWRELRISSMTDLILMKLLRVKQIEDNKGKTVASEGIDANYRDIINYSIFALIKIEEQKQKNKKA
ncbi:MAG: DUF1599 domain-containing protein [Saprospiraceae bacterium]|nr:DUF1599 domain-containing protein [Saprospiraceae bacterium]